MKPKLNYVIKGKWYILECGWGKTKAKSEGYMRMDDGKIKYDWVTARGFHFISYDLENVELF